MGQAREVELVVDIGGEGGRGEGVDFGGVGDAVFEILVRAELEGGVESGLADEDEVVVFREVSPTGGGACRGHRRAEGGRHR